MSGYRNTRGKEWNRIEFFVQAVRADWRHTGKIIIAPRAVCFVLMNRETFDLLTVRCRNLLDLTNQMCRKSMDLLKLEASQKMGLTQSGVNLQLELNRLRVLLRRSASLTLKSVKCGDLDALQSKFKSGTANDSLYSAGTQGIIEEGT